MKAQQGPPTGAQAKAKDKDKRAAMSMNQKSSGTATSSTSAGGDDMDRASAGKADNMNRFLKQNADKLATSTFNEIDMMCQLSKYDRFALMIMK
jgi:hypothetical protein